MTTNLRALSFPVEEYRDRLRRVQNEMAALDLDALLCHSAANVCYVTGFEAVLWFKYVLAVIPREGDPILLAQDFEMPNADVTSWCEDRETYPVFGDPIAVTKELLTRRGLTNKRLGIELNRWSLSVPAYLKLRDALPDATLVDATAVVDRVKRVKSPAEIAVIRRCADITSRGMNAALDSVKVGATDNDVAAVAYQELIGAGSEYMALDPIVTVGARSGVPHSTHRQVKIGAGETVLIEVGACVHRYSTASMRAVVTEPVPAVARRMYEACRASVDIVVQNMKPGAVADAIAQQGDAIMTEWRKDFVWPGTYGYSIGIGFPPDWNDAPAIIMRGSEIVLEPGMVFHVSTSLRHTGVRGVAFCETILVTETGAEILTNVPRELRVAR